MKHYSKIEDIEEYFQSSDIDQSKLKRAGLGLNALLDDRESKLYFEEKESLLIGSLVDCFITHTEEDFEKLYYVSSLVSKPTDSMKSIITWVFDRSLELVEDLEEWFKMELKDFPELILQAFTEHAYQERWTTSTKIDNTVKFSEYFNELKNARGKTVLSLEEYTLAKQIQESLNSLKILNAPEDFEVYYQLPIYFMYKNKKSKALLDILIVDKKNKSLWVIDIKTTARGTLDFPFAVSKYRYDIQISYYLKAVKSIEEYTDYKMDCMFVVESTTHLGNPLVFLCTEDLLKEGEFGREPIYIGDTLIKQRVLGFSQLMDKYKYYESTGFTQEKETEIFNKQGYLILGKEGIEEVE